MYKKSKFIQISYCYCKYLIVSMCYRGIFYLIIDRARVRVQISAAHSEQDIQQAVEAFHSVTSELGIL